MKNNYLEIGATPCEEPCAQVGSADYSHWSRLECQTYINQLRREHGPEPDGAKLTIRSNPHDFGTYYEAACIYEESNEEATDYAYAVEAGCMQWDEEARKELKEQRYPLTSEFYDPEIAGALRDATDEIRKSFDTSN